MKNVAIFSVILCFLVACSPDMPDDASATGSDIPASIEEVTGTLMYRERIALPPGSFAEIWLLDTSLADVPAVEISYQRIDEPGSPPIPFALDYDPAKIREGMQYTVRATIRHADQLLFTSDTHYPVLTRGAGNTADILLVQVQGDR